jgi:hypothetical protein
LVISRTAANTLALLSLVLCAASLCSATNITYSIDQTIGTGSVTGNIVTDGTIGVLAQADILGYDLLLTDETYTAELSSAFSLDFFPFSGSDLSATPTQLLFNFSGTDDGVVDIADPSLDYQLAFCTSGCFSGAGETIHFLTPSFTFDNLLTSLSGTQAIGTTSTPEPTSLALLGGGMIALLGLRKLKFPLNSK